jgi:beta-mannosidase
MTMLRVWGGGYYESEQFYDRCDEHGLLVWQDFMFSCALYPASEEFLDTVAEEVRYQVRRLSSHPSLALWCGNNENEEVLHSWYADHSAHERHVEDFERLYAETIAPTCREEAGDVPYWPGSPSSGPDVDDPDRFEHGDVHYWEVWHSEAPLSAYLETEPRFVSEFGYQSFPSPGSLDGIISPAERNPSSPTMEYHQRDPGGNARILQQMAGQFRLPWGFEDFVYRSQLLQLEAMRTAIEHWRRRKPTTMGALYWQLNDLWPVVSWSSLEYDGAWKAQHHGARRQFAPLLLSFAPSDAPAESHSNFVYDRGAVGELSLWLTSDLPRRLEGTVTLTVATTTGDVLDRREHSVDIDPQESVRLTGVAPDDLPTGVDPSAIVVRATYEGTGQVESYPATGFFNRYKTLELPPPDLTVSVDGHAVTVSSDCAALFVRLRADGGVFSDNYFHLFAGESRTVTFEPRTDAGTGTSLADDIEVTHLRAGHAR